MRLVRPRRFDPGPDDERELLARLRAGDEAAFTELFDGAFQGLYRFALSRLDGDVELAKEVAQAAFCKAFEKLDGYRGEGAIFTWLCAICRFEISAHFRRRHREPPESEVAGRRPDAAEGAAAPAGGWSGAPDDPEQQLLRGEVARQVHAAVDGLPTHYGRALEWKYAEGLSVREIGDRLGMTTKAAESLLGRARIAFRAGFEQAPLLAVRPAGRGEGRP
jgi:RNA polymerase sigma-70 factor (ECF subfamily)